MQAELAETAEFWAAMVSALSAKSSASVGELYRMDIFDFFAMLSAAEKKEK